MKRYILIFKALSPLAFHGISGHNFHSGLSPDITLPRDPITGLPVFYGVKGVMKDLFPRLDDCRCRFSPAFLFAVELPDGWYRVYSDEIEDGHLLKDEWLCRWGITPNDVWKILETNNNNILGINPAVKPTIPLSRVIDVVPRNKLSYEKHIAENTWTEEELPIGSVLVAVAWCEDNCIPIDTCDRHTSPCKHHIGGGLTTGHGQVEVRVGCMDYPNKKSGNR